jgi:hypothetical protein
MDPGAAPQISAENAPRSGREYSYLEIARLFGRDHTTVMHGVAAHRNAALLGVVSSVAWKAFYSLRVRPFLL